MRCGLGHLSETHSLAWALLTAGRMLVDPTEFLLAHPPLAVVPSSIAAGPLLEKLAVVLGSSGLVLRAMFWFANAVSVTRTLAVALVVMPATVPFTTNVPGAAYALGSTASQTTGRYSLTPSLQTTSTVAGRPGGVPTGTTVEKLPTPPTS